MMAFEKITSVQNAFIKKVVHLRDRRTRQKEGLTIVEGVREIQTAWAASERTAFERIYFCPELFKDDYGLLKEFAVSGVTVCETTLNVFEKITLGGDRQEGLLGVCRFPQTTLKSLKLGKDPLCVVVESVEKPGNLGAIIRTCDAAKADVLIVCGGLTEIYNPNTVRASLGAAFTVPAVAATNEEALEFLRSNKIKTFATFPDTKKYYTDSLLTGPTAIILGSEQDGLSDFWSKNADEKIKIPLLGKVNSLNVAVCAAVVVYEAVRQRAV